MQTRARAPVPRFRWWLGGLIAVGLVVRLITIASVGQVEVAGRGDAVYYHLQANAIAEGEWFPVPEISVISDESRPDAQHPPLFPLVVAGASVLGFDSMTQHQILGAFIGSISVLLVGLLGRRVGGDRVGLVAAALMTLWPSVWVHEFLMLSESVTVLLAAAVLLAAYRYLDRSSPGRAAALGALCGLAALSRTELVLLFPFLVFPLVLARAPDPKRFAGGLAAAAVAALAVLGPWVIPNLFRFEKPIVFTAQGGVTLTIASCDSTFSGDRIGYSDLGCVPPLSQVSVPEEQRDQLQAAREVLFAHLYREETAYQLFDGERSVPVPLERCAPLLPDQPDLTEEECNDRLVEVLDRAGDASEIEADYYQVGSEYVGDHLGELPRVVAARIGRTFGLYRPVQQIELESDIDNRPAWTSWWSLILWYPLAGLAVYGAVLLKQRRFPLLPLLVFPVTTLLAVIIALGSTRFRCATDVVVVVLASVAVVALWDRWSAGRSPARRLSGAGRSEDDGAVVAADA
jgi:4-amino-4-deoxy-L-arabinose transferase-like glycosyltransferase